ncbi:putative hypothetical glutamine rich protein [Phaeomoniella chlamydospora]|uniref:Putative hypothetical glutamine rich protein n=1 Tax=Phaeomoniella chlamydospora TaxID=158046 RepID=A0A0G2H9W5_PHACM|nr:putative hypothetical glutamine rich protein [Phaeomoniella chlamydospora]
MTPEQLNEEIKKAEAAKTTKCMKQINEARCTRDILAVVLEYERDKRDFLAATKDLLIQCHPDRLQGNQIYTKEDKDEANQASQKLNQLKEAIKDNPRLADPQVKNLEGQGLHISAYQGIRLFDDDTPESLMDHAGTHHEDTSVYDNEESRVKTDIGDFHKKIHGKAIPHLVSMQKEAEKIALERPLSSDGIKEKADLIQYFNLKIKDHNKKNNLPDGLGEINVSQILSNWMSARLVLATGDSSQKAENAVKELQRSLVCRDQIPKGWTLWKPNFDLAYASPQERMDWIKESGYLNTSEPGPRPHPTTGNKDEPKPNSRESPLKPQTPLPSGPFATGSVADGALVPLTSRRGNPLFSKPVLRDIKPGYTDEGDKILAYLNLGTGKRYVIERPDGAHEIISGADAGGRAVQINEFVPRVANTIDSGFMTTILQQGGTYGINWVAMAASEEVVYSMPTVVVEFYWNKGSESKIVSKSALERAMGKSSASRLMAKTINERGPRGETFEEALLAVGVRLMFAPRELRCLGAPRMPRALLLEQSGYKFPSGGFAAKQIGYGDSSSPRLIEPSSAGEPGTYQSPRYPTQLSAEPYRSVQQRGSAHSPSTESSPPDISRLVRNMTPDSRLELARALEELNVREDAVPIPSDLMDTST